MCHRPLRGAGHDARPGWRSVVFGQLGAESDCGQNGGPAFGRDGFQLYPAVCFGGRGGLYFGVCRRFAAAVFLRSLLTGAIKAIGLGGVNRFLGAVFGLLRGFAVVTLVVLVCAFTDLPKSDEWQNAYSSPFFEGAASVAVPYLPEYLAKKVSYPSF